MGVEGPERVEVEVRKLNGRELSADWRSGPAGEHLVCREVGTGRQSRRRAAVLITLTWVLQRLQPQGFPGSLISLWVLAGCWVLAALDPALDPALSINEAVNRQGHSFIVRSFVPFIHECTLSLSLTIPPLIRVTPSLQSNHSINQLVRPLSACPA